MSIQKARAVEAGGPGEARGAALAAAPTDSSARPALWRRAVAELLGTGLLVAVVVGSGIAAQRLSPADVGLQLLENVFAITLALAVLIALFGPVSGAHFNPVVTLADLARSVLDRRRDPARPGPTDAAVYIGAQVLGAIGGAVLANVMFDVPTTLAGTERVSPGTLLGEVVATAGLMLVILGLARTGQAALGAPVVAAYIGAAAWFTSSTSFANPAVTVGRVFSDTFAGIAPGSVVPFVGAQLVGGAVGLALALMLFVPTSQETTHLS